ncbi:hypothetical protein, partial [Chitinophaga costaii]
MNPDGVTKEANGINCLPLFYCRHCFILIKSIGLGTKIGSRRKVGGLMLKLFFCGLNQHFGRELPSVNR